MLKMGRNMRSTITQAVVVFVIFFNLNLYLYLAGYGCNYLFKFINIKQYTDCASQAIARL